MKIKIGCVAICRKKRVGIVTHSKVKRTGGAINGCKTTTWHGIGFDGKPWQSKDPSWLADNVTEVIDNLRKHKGM